MTYFPTLECESDLHSIIKYKIYIVKVYVNVCYRCFLPWPVHLITLDINNINCVPLLNRLGPKITHRKYQNLFRSVGVD